MADLIEVIGNWFAAHNIPDPEIAPMLEGFMLGLAVAIRHGEYATGLHKKVTESFKLGIAGSALLYAAAAVASGDERTEVEMLADKFAQVVDTT